MKKYSTDQIEGSSAYWEQLEAFARLGVQKLLQQVLEEEITALLGRERSERKDPVDSKEGYRNSYGRARKLSMSCGTIVVRRPRVRDLTERFESRILPLFKRRTEEVGRLLPELYLNGLSEGMIS
ncbi:MAG: transposase [Minisyncoccia bacterium]|jgi:transposase-like protein